MPRAEVRQKCLLFSAVVVPGRQAGGPAWACPWFDSALWALHGAYKGTMECPKCQTDSEKKIIQQCVSTAAFPTSGQLFRETITLKTKSGILEKSSWIYGRVRE